MFNKVKKFIDESFGKEDKHLERTIYWLKKIEPNVDEPMLIAAYAHDIARASRKKGPIDFFKDKELDDKKYIEEHQKNGAKIIKKFLSKEGYDKESIDRVYKMVRFHEVGGEPEADLIKDADSLSYLEVNAVKQIYKFIKPLGKDKIKRKIDWMYDRITSGKAKELAKPYYKKAIKVLN